MLHVSRDSKAAHLSPNDEIIDKNSILASPPDPDPDSIVQHARVIDSSPSR